MNFQKDKGSLFLGLFILLFLSLTLYAGQDESKNNRTMSIIESGVGHWEIFRKIDYRSIPKASLKGNIDPSHMYYTVTLAGFHTDAFGISAGLDDDVRYTMDGGKTWTISSDLSKGLFCRHGLDVVSEKIVWHSGNQGIAVSSDGCRTWRKVSSIDCPFLTFLDDRNGWFADPYFHTLQSTVDGGSSWSTVTLPSAMKDIAAISIRTIHDGYILDTSGNLFVTADGARTWKVRSLGLKNGKNLITSKGSPLAALRFFDASYGMAVFDLADGSVWFAVTRNGGKIWQTEEIVALRNQSYYYHLFLSRDGNLLTATNDFNIEKPESVVLRYRQKTVP